MRLTSAPDEPQCAVSFDSKSILAGCEAFFGGVWRLQSSFSSLMRCDYVLERIVPLQDPRIWFGTNP